MSATSSAAYVDSVRRLTRRLIVAFERGKDYGRVDLLAMELRDAIAPANHLTLPPDLADVPNGTKARLEELLSALNRGWGFYSQPSRALELLRAVEKEFLEPPWDGDDWEELEARVRRLLKYMHGRESADLEELCPEVWTKDAADVSDSAVSIAISLANKFLLKRQYPHTLCKVRREPTVRWK